MKKLLVSIFAVLILVAMLALWGVNGVLASSDPIYGDANGDHHVDISDKTKIEREILGLDLLTPGADANIDGVVDVGDMTWVKRQIFGLSPVYGDADGNLTVNQADITKVERIIFGLDPPTRGADANRDGHIDIGDVTAIERMID